MADRFTRTCPKGHQWQAADDGAAAAEICPICGGWAETLKPADARTPPDYARQSPELPASQGPLPVVPGYRLESELGRGGMGIVYQAVQEGLERTVAIKMLVAGNLASPGLLARFRTEAEAVARLAHPNIVQIFEIGEAAGHPFLSFEYLSGGTLSNRASQGPQPPRECAALVATLARAMYYAHQHGIIHRDLKPANVLLTEDGTPKIADFGLAKHLASESGQTHTGDVMGSPSYMAPEQARGATQQIGPACDIYALGAILYELLTGRPPLLGQDTIETLLLVLHEEPVPPRRLAPKVPRDLETICLKCLSKSPRSRYDSAADLADDLERFLTSRPIKAQPASATELLVKWARRRPAVAALVAVSMAAAATVILYGGWKNAQLRTSLAQQQALRERAEANFRKALDAADRRLTRAGRDPQRLLQEELAFFDEIRAQPDDDPQARYEKGMAARRAGDVHRLMGNAQYAERAYNDAIAKLSALAEAAPNVTDYRRDLAAAHDGLAQLDQSTGKLDEAERHSRAGLKLLTRLAEEEPAEPDYRRQMGVVWNNLAIQLSRAERLDEALDAHRQALAIRRRLSTEFANSSQFRLDESTSHANLGALYWKMKRSEESQNELREAIRLRETLAESMTAEAEFRLASAGLSNNLAASLSAENKSAEAMDAWHKAIETLTKLIADYPDAPGYQSMLADTHFNLALAQARQGKFDKAAETMTASLAIWQKLIEAHPQAPEYAASAKQVSAILDDLKQQIAKTEAAAAAAGNQPSR
ncbi:MAG TPA: serine/threonine-protein kinase [Pirellulales bacterium]